MMSLFETLGRLRRDTSGNVAMMFGLVGFTLLTGSGVALDYTRMSNAQSAIAAAADAAALAGASTRGDTAARKNAAKRVFEANLNLAGISAPVEVHYHNQTTSGVNTGYTVRATATVKAYMGTFTGAAERPVAARSEAKTGSDGITEIAFVLDTTESMEGDRIDGLKAATIGILDEIGTRNLPAGRVKYGVVPFAQYVNVGLSMRNQPWLDVRADYQEPITNYCRSEYPQVGENNCRNVNFPAESSTPSYTCVRDGRAFTCPGYPGRPARTERVCDPVYSPTPRNVCTPQGGNWVRWDGCVGSRAHPHETTDSRYDIKIPGLMGIGCGSPILDLTTDVSTVRATISSLRTSGETYLPSGFIWGWRMLSGTAPLNNASNVSGTRKFMILVTDGKNTRSPTYPLHDGADAVLADTLTRETCTNLARDATNQIRVFTIAYAMDGLEAKRILEECAGRTGGGFYDASDAGKLRESLGKIMDSIFAVKLTH